MTGQYNLTDGRNTLSTEKSVRSVDWRTDKNEIRR